MRSPLRPINIGRRAATAHELRLDGLHEELIFPVQLIEQCPAALEVVASEPGVLGLAGNSAYAATH
jgi:hypothetical protein